MHPRGDVPPRRIAMVFQDALGSLDPRWNIGRSIAEPVAAFGLRTGKVAVNSEPMPHPALPEGGCKASGFGRELGPDAVEACLETQSLLIRLR